MLFDAPILSSDIAQNRPSENAMVMLMSSTSMLHRGNPLALANKQLQILSSHDYHRRFETALRESGFAELTAQRLEILQVNVGKLCNMTCAHCHVDAGPDRRESMTRETVDACLDALRSAPAIHTLDLTGGAPEMNPNFRYFVQSARGLGRHVIDRCNLTILLAAGYDDMPKFLADNQVELVASLPCYLEENADSQRGDGSFRKSIAALQQLNSLGYGAADSGLTLTLVYNPVGPSLPPEQSTLEEAYRRELRERYHVEFTRLFTITNMPISRYLDYLVQSSQYDAYMQKLIAAFNPAAIQGLMCRNTLSVGWDGTLYDCDFNQMLELGLQEDCPRHIADFDPTRIQRRRIIVGQHCYGCTAGAGSGCQGAIDS